jgi:hypothetical protein
MTVIAVDEYSPAPPKSTNSTRFVKGNLQVPPTWSYCTWLGGQAACMLSSPPHEPGPFRITQHPAEARIRPSDTDTPVQGTHMHHMHYRRHSTYLLHAPLY